MKKTLKILLLLFVTLISACARPAKRNLDEEKRREDAAKANNASVVTQLNDLGKVVKNVFYYRIALGSIEYPISPENFLYFKDDSTVIQDGRPFPYTINVASKQITIEKSSLYGGNEYFAILAFDKVRMIFQASSSSQSLYSFYNANKFISSSNFGVVRLQQFPDGHVEPDLANGQLYILKEQDDQLNKALKTYLAARVKSLDNPIASLESMISSCNSIIAAHPQFISDGDQASLKGYQPYLDSIIMFRTQIAKGNFKFDNTLNNPFIKLGDKLSDAKDIQRVVSNIWNSMTDSTKNIQ